MLSFVAGGLFMFFAGLELRFLSLQADAKFLSVGFLGAFCVPFFIGYVAFNQNVFLALALSISAIPVAIQILKEKNRFDTSFGRRSITIASLCDIAAWLAMAFLFPSKDLLSWILKHWVVAAFFVGLFVIQLLGSRPGAAPVIGSFHHPVIQQIQTWVLAPLLFIGLGWQVDLSTSFSVGLTLKVLIVAIAAKGLGTFIAMRVMRVKVREAFEYSALLNARGAMEIFAASLAFRAGLISESLMAALVILGIVTSLIAVPLVGRQPLRGLD